MWKKILSVCLAVLMAVLLFTACASKETTLQLPVSSIPASCDPVLSDSTALSTVAENCFEGLVRIDENGNVQPGAADHWNLSDDGLTYTFILRDGLKWRIPDADDEKAAERNPLGKDFIQNFPTAVTADDFVFGLQRSVAKNTAAPGASLLFGIQNAQSVNAGEMKSTALGVSAVDDKTVRIHLSAPDGNFLTALGAPCAMPCSRAFFTKTEGRYGLSPSLLPSNGPYYLKGMDAQGKSLTLAKNSDYVGLTPGTIDQCTLVLGKEQVDPDEASDAKGVLNDLRSKDGTLDGAILTENSVSSLPKTFQVTKYKNIENMLLFNLNSSFAGNSDLRLALAYATDPSKLIADGATPSRGLIPDCCNAVSGTQYRNAAGTASGLDFSLKKAKKHYTDAMDQFNAVATKEDPAPTSFKIKFLCLAEDKQIAQASVQNWQKVFGTALSTSIETRDTEEELSEALSAGNYDVAFAPIRCSELTAIGVLRQYSGDTDKNLVNLADDAYDSLLEKAAAADRPGSVTRYCLAAEEYLMKQGILLPISEETTCLAVKSKTATGLPVYPTGDTYLIYLVGEQ